MAMMVAEGASGERRRTILAVDLEEHRPRPRAER